MGYYPPEETTYYLSCPDPACHGMARGIGTGESAKREAMEHAFGLLWHHLQEEHGAQSADDRGVASPVGTITVPLRSWWHGVRRWLARRGS